MSAGAAPRGTGPWRILILDREPGDSRWVIATVTLSSDVRPAVLDDAGRYAGWGEAVAWVESRLGHPVALMPVHDALAWRIDQGGQRR